MWNLISDSSLINTHRLLKRQLNHHRPTCVVIPRKEMSEVDFSSASVEALANAQASYEATLL